MKYLIDAQLPQACCEWLRTAGIDSIHTSALMRGNRTSDQELITIADAEGRVLVSKDSNFVDSHLLRGKPAKLLLISSGNIPNEELWMLLQSSIHTTTHEFETVSFIELSREGIIVR